MVTAAELSIGVAAINEGFDIYDAIMARQGMAQLDAAAKQAAVDAYVKASQERYAAGSKAADAAIAAARAKPPTPEPSSTA